MQQARCRGLVSVESRGQKVYVNQLKKGDIVKRILAHDSSPANFGKLKEEAEKRGIAVGRANQRELRMKLVKHDDKIPLQPELVDISFLSSASEVSSDGGEAAVESDDMSASDGEGQRVAGAGAGGKM